MVAPQDVLRIAHLPVYIQKMYTWLYKGLPAVFRRYRRNLEPQHTLKASLMYETGE